MARILPKAAAAAAASIKLAGLRSPFPSCSSSAVPRSIGCWPLLCFSPWAPSSLRSRLRFAKTVDLIEARGTAMRDTDFVKGGKTVIVFIKDPDYSCRFLGGNVRSLAMFMALSMELLRKQGNAEFKGFVDNIDFSIETEQSMAMNEFSAVSTSQASASHSTVPVLDQSCKASASDFTLYMDRLCIYF